MKKYILIFAICFLSFSCSKGNENTTTTGSINESTTTTGSGINKVDLNKNILNKKINLLSNKLKLGKIEESEKEALSLYENNKDSLILLNMLGNIYLLKRDIKTAIKYLEEANKISQGVDGYILFNLGVSYSNIDKQKAMKYLEEAKKIIPNDKNLDNFIKNIK